MRLVTWNINSIRARTHLVEDFVKQYDPDVICLQETKAMDDQFPVKFIQALGYEHMALHGMKSYHGVATLSKKPFQSTEIIDWCNKGDARHIAVKLAEGPTLHNFYVPAGGDVADPEVNDKFAHKIQFLEEMTEWSRRLSEPSILVGDLNIAPHEHDVWDTKKLKKVVSHTPLERDMMFELMAAHDWVDVMRDFVPLDEKLYSWWSYRAKDWSAADKGRRLDHIWTSPSLKGKAKAMEMVRAARGWEKPSDHAPVLVDFDF
ncbi:exodeoxyribonuclease III [Temperatibacter marinus]|uniref:Exodeoxyribonuclease III n=1 Tax=Temperatibacter marinus TaxID=1456591 RepID=A0AA52H9R1_9PROT|nr:exodeoxyribonuclease III [Temperatibacter marinus]WND03456.1 exodeoxyribonuclease III [Temperatibacter marinus]